MYPSMQDSEARTELLRTKARGSYDCDEVAVKPSTRQKHINFFEDVEEGVCHVYLAI